ncbi:MAG TPA: hypothetical protein VE130_09435 [Nitrososphaeraceae archaeon]|nr:hypothetical protein [Nitrososphaeraceae archaeon]
MFKTFTTITILSSFAFICFLYLLKVDNVYLAYGHFFGQNITRDGYQVIFQPFPFSPIAGENTTLNFSILDEENLNIHNIFSALTIKEKESNETMEQIPYKQYTYSDITFPYKFSNNSDYFITLETRIIGDPKYQAQPLVATFELVVGDQVSEYFKTIMLYFVTPACVVIIVAILIYELYWKSNRSSKRKILD